MVSVPSNSNVVSNYLGVRNSVKLNSQADELTKYVPWTDWYPAQNLGTLQISYTSNVTANKWYQIGDEVTIAFSFNILKSGTNNTIRLTNLPVAPVNTIGMQNIIMVKQLNVATYLTAVASVQMVGNSAILLIDTIGDMTDNVVYTIAGQVKYNVNLS